MSYFENEKENGTDEVHNLLKHLHRWAFEYAGITVFRERFGAISHDKTHDVSRK